MAEEEEKEPAKGGSKLLVIIIAILVLLLVGGAAAFYFLVMPKMAVDAGSEKTEEEIAIEKAQEELAGIGESVELDSFVVNLEGDSGRYLKTTLVLQVSSAMAVEEISSRGPQIKDAVITILSSKPPEDILSVQGKYDLKVELIKRINSFIKAGVVKELYFIEFVVQ